jgi:hypothetical protein
MLRGAFTLIINFFDYVSKKKLSVNMVKYLLQLTSLDNTEFMLFRGQTKLFPAFLKPLKALRILVQ